MAEVVALKAFLKVTPKLYKPELTKVLKDVPGAGKPLPVDPSLAASKY